MYADVCMLDMGNLENLGSVTLETRKYNLEDIFVFSSFFALAQP